MNILLSIGFVFDKKIREIIKNAKKDTTIDLTGTPSVPLKYLKKYINKNVQVLKLSSIKEFKENLEYLKTLPSLEELYLETYEYITEEELNQINQLGIKKLYIRDLKLNYDNITNEFMGLQSSECTKLIFNGMTVNVSAENRKTSKSEIKIMVPTLDEKAIYELTKEINLKEINHFEIQTLNSNYFVWIKNEEVIDMNVKCNSITDAEKFYNYFGNKTIEKLKISIENNDYTFDTLEKFTDLFKEKRFKEYHLEFIGKDIYTKLTAYDNIFKLEYKCLNDLSKVEYYLKYLKENNFNINEIILNIEELDKYSETFDMNLLRRLSKEYNLKINYKDNYTSNYEDFFALRESIIWYRKLINEYNLSPIEKLTFASDIVKTFSYKDTKEETEFKSAPHLIIKNANIVCLGYSKLLMEILNGLDNNLGISVSLIDSIMHARNIVRIDDEKYNIHGLFEIDNTWDSNLGEKSKTLLNYDFYGFFLIPINEHKKVFPTEDYPRIWNCTYNPNQYDINDLLLYKKDIRLLFGFNADKEKVSEYLKTRKPTLEEFKQIIYNVRIAEGYTPKEATKEVEKIIEVNNNTYRVEEAYTDSFRKGK